VARHTKKLVASGAGKLYKQSKKIKSPAKKHNTPVNKNVLYCFYKAGKLNWWLLPVREDVSAKFAIGPSPNYDRSGLMKSLHWCCRRTQTGAHPV